MDLLAVSVFQMLTVFISSFTLDFSGGKIQIDKIFNTTNEQKEGYQMKESLTKETLEAFQNDFRANTLHTVAKNAVTVNGLLNHPETARSPQHKTRIFHLP